MAVIKAKVLDNNTINVAKNITVIILWYLKFKQEFKIKTNFNGQCVQYSSI